MAVIDLLFAVAAGVLTVASPCVLPMLPILFGTSLGSESRVRPLFIAAGFTLSFSALALGFGLFSNLLGLSPERARVAAVASLLIFGVLMLWPRPFEWLTSHLGGGLNRIGAVGNRGGSGLAGGLLLGMSLGVVWTPCAGPVLGSILTLIATAQHLHWAAVLLLCYAAGASIPMLAVAYGGQYASTRVRRLAPHARTLQRGFGVVVILIAAAIYWQYDASVAGWLSRFYPRIGVSL